MSQFNCVLHYNKPLLHFRQQVADRPDKKEIKLQKLGLYAWRWLVGTTGSIYWCIVKQCHIQIISPAFQVTVCHRWRRKRHFLFNDGKKYICFCFHISYLIIQMQEKSTKRQSTAPLSDVFIFFRKLPSCV